MKRQTSIFLFSMIFCIVSGIFFACNRNNGSHFSPDGEYTYTNEDDDNQAEEDVSSDTTLSSSSPTAPIPSSTSSTSSYSHNSRFDDGYEHGLEDGEDDADRSRYNAHSRRGGDYDRGYQNGYEEAEEDDE